MGWKDWPSWLKGGIITEIIIIILLIIFLPLKIEFGFFTASTKIPFSLFLLIPGSFILILLGLNSDNLIASGLLSIILYFIIGAFIGWLYSKIKSRGEK